MILIGATVRVRGFSGVACVYQGPETRPGTPEQTCDACCGLGDTSEDDSYERCEVCDGTGETYDEEPEPEETGRALVRMIGDDHTHRVDYSDLTEISESEFCHGCGDMRCHHSRPEPDGSESEVGA